MKRLKSFLLKLQISDKQEKHS